MGLIPCCQQLIRWARLLSVMRMPRRVAVVWALLLLVGLPCTGEGTSVPCFVGPNFAPAGTRVRLAGGPGYGDFKESEAIYVAHGALLQPPCFVDKTHEWICDYIHSAILFELYISGAPQTPDYIHVSPSEETTDTGDVQTRWLVHWVYEFPAMHFQSELYSFEGTWITPDTTNPDCWPESSIGRDAGGAMAY